MLVSEAEKQLLQATRLIRSLDEQAASLRLQELQRALASNPELLESLVGRMQLEYGMRKMAEEVGEVAGVLKRHLDYGETIDADRLTGELGNVLFFLVFIARCAGIPLQHIVDKQVSATQKRFGDAWTIEAASRRPEEQPKAETHASGGRQKAEEDPSGLRSAKLCEARESRSFLAVLGEVSHVCDEESFFAVSRKAHAGRRLSCCRNCAQKLLPWGTEQSIVGRDGVNPSWWPSPQLDAIEDLLKAISRLREIGEESEAIKKENALWQSKVFLAALNDAVISSPNMISVVRVLWNHSPRTMIRFLRPAIGEIKSVIKSIPVNKDFDDLDLLMAAWVDGNDTRAASRMKGCTLEVWNENYDGHGHYDPESALAASVLVDMAACAESSSKKHRSTVEFPTSVAVELFALFETKVRWRVCASLQRDMQER